MSCSSIKKGNWFTLVILDYFFRKANYAFFFSFRIVNAFLNFASSAAWDSEALLSGMVFFSNPIRTLLLNDDLGYLFLVRLLRGENALERLLDAESVFSLRPSSSSTICKSIIGYVDFLLKCCGAAWDDFYSWKLHISLKSTTNGSNLVVDRKNPWLGLVCSLSTLGLNPYFPGIDGLTC